MPKSYPLPEDLRKSYDATVLLINDLTAEAASLKEKFGDRSKLFQSKLAQIETIKSLYNGTANYIDKVTRHNTHLGVKLMGVEIQLAQIAFDMTFVEAMRYHGYPTDGLSPEFIKMHEEADELIRKAIDLQKKSKA
jgi:hypothetical protein